MDKFDYFLQYLNELVAQEPDKKTGDAAMGYWLAIRSIQRALSIATQAGGGEKHGS
jgi:hypothetical protein